MKKIGIALAAGLLLILFSLVVLNLVSPKEEPREEAREPGFEILYKKAVDRSGRTVFYSGRGFYDGIGTGLRDVVGGKLQVEYVTGAVNSSGLVSIPDTDDFYILLVDPQIGEDLTGDIRILGANRDDLRATKIAVEDLNRPAEDAQSLIGFADLIPREDLEKIIRPGDAVAVEFYVKEEAVFDDQGRRIIESIVLRRYGGLKQIREEFAGESSDSFEFLR